MATYYVKPSGSDSNNGESIETAWLTTEHAQDTMISGDDAIVIASNDSQTIMHCQGQNSTIMSS